MATTSVGKLLPIPPDQTPVLICNRLPPNTTDH